MHQNVLTEEVSEGLRVGEHNVDVVVIVRGMLGDSVVLLQALRVEEVVGDGVARRRSISGGSLLKRVQEKIMKNYNEEAEKHVIANSGARFGQSVENIRNHTF